MSDSLRLHESQHARPPCPTPTPGVHSDSRPSSQWCHLAISSSVVPFSSCPQSLPAQWSYMDVRVGLWRKLSTKELMLLNCGCWRRPLRVPLTEKTSNQSILKETSPGCSLEGLLLKLKFQYFGYLMQTADSFEKTLILGKIEGRRRWGWQRMRWLDGYHQLYGHEFG